MIFDREYNMWQTLNGNLHADYDEAVRDEAHFIEERLKSAKYSPSYTMYDDECFVTDSLGDSYLIYFATIDDVWWFMMDAIDYGDPVVRLTGKEVGWVIWNFDHFEKIESNIARFITLPVKAPRLRID